MLRLAAAVAAAVIAAPLMAQDDPIRRMDFWVRGNVQFYDNFFQNPDGQPQEDVTALGTEAGGSLRLTNAVRGYAQFSYLHFNDDTLEGSPGIRVGVRGDLRPHAFDVYAEHLNNRPSFELDEFVGADINRIAAEYSYRFLKDWQASVDADYDEHDLGGAPGTDNQYAGFGAAIRWRGSRVFSPELGFRTGERDVDDTVQSYAQSEIYLQVRSQPTERWYLSVRLRDRRRDYGLRPRDDTRRQIAASADYTIHPSLVLNFYGAREDNDTTVANRDASWGFLSAGVTWRF